MLFWSRSTARAAATLGRSRSSSPTAARPCWPRCVESGEWIARNTSRGAPGHGAGCRATPRAVSTPTSRLVEEPDHSADRADQADVGRHDGLVGRVLRDQADMPVAALEALDRGLAVDQGHDDGALRRLLLRPDQDHVAV